MTTAFKIATMEDYEQELARIDDEVAQLRQLYGMEQVTLEQRAERYERKQALLATVRPAPKWNI